MDDVLLMGAGMTLGRTSKENYQGYQALAMPQTISIGQALEIRIDIWMMLLTSCTIMQRTMATPKLRTKSYAIFARRKAMA
jgi:hypothetical protein